MWAHAQRLGCGLEHLHGVQGCRSTLFLVFRYDAEYFYGNTGRILTELCQRIRFVLVETSAARPLRSAHSSTLENAHVQDPVWSGLKRLDLDVALNTEAERGCLTWSIRQYRTVEIFVSPLEIPRLETRECHAHLEVELLTSIHTQALAFVGLSQSPVGFGDIGRINCREVRAIDPIIVGNATLTATLHQMHDAIQNLEGNVLTLPIAVQP
mmetsp:Transcript_17819/g.51015  ORF Transcript_17819/g.51015 Transcript_17819/m.51015 type:complete len:211 (+) Transcript_17819:1258-1890(+)